MATATATATAIQMEGDKLSKYLAMREAMKEKIRLKFHKRTSSSIPTTTTVPQDEIPKFGSFFGPSLPSIATRVLRDTNFTSIIQQQRINVTKKEAIRESRDYSFLSSDSSSAPPTNPVQGPNQKPTKSKKEIIRESRDYSFLSSDSAHPKQDKDKVKPPAAAISPAPQKIVPVPKPRAAAVNPNPLATTKSAGNQKTIKRPIPQETNPNPDKAAGISKPPAATTPAPQKIPKPRAAVNPNPLAKPKSIKRPIPQETVNNKVIKSPATNPNPKKVVAHEIPRKSKVIVNPNPRGFSKSGVGNQKSTKAIVRPEAGKRAEEVAKDLVNRKKSDDVVNVRKRPRSVEEEEEDGNTVRALMEIRRMFNTKRFVGRDDRDLRGMESTFEDIGREERKSTKLARKEDAEELRLLLLEEEKKKEKKRLMAKKRKISD